MNTFVQHPSLEIRPLHLTHLYGEMGYLNDAQRRIFQWQALHLLEMSNDSTEKDALFCLNSVWRSYDSGWHSCGRSMRSLLLEGSIAFLEAGKISESREPLCLLLAIHHNIKYMNEQRWMDFEVKHPYDAGMMNLFYLTIASRLLGIDELPPIESVTREKVIELYQLAHN